ncbi:MAG: ABC transporter permease [Defluviitaleaceae bacterium]|nr:ABC transporter permease [Defluviitaleaceae bacterium]
MKNSIFLGLDGLLNWSITRHKYILPSFSILQIILAVAMVYGLALFIYDIDEISAIYLSSGTIVMGIISVGCVLCAQIVSETKQNGIFDYQRSLPVSRFSIILSDLIIWGSAALPGIIISIIAVISRFGIVIHISITSIFIIIISLATMILIGFTVAYYLKPNVVGMVTQLIMIISLLFSPITFPSDRLPNWTFAIYNIFPFVPISNLIRASLFNFGVFNFANLFNVIGWFVICLFLSVYSLSKKQ